MNYRFFYVVFFVVGMFFLVLGFINDEVEVGFFLIFPFLIGKGVFAVSGVFFIFLAVLFFMLNLATGSTKIFLDEEKTHVFDSFSGGVEKKKNSSFKAGGVVLIGPIPIVFGSNWKIALILMLTALFIMVSWFVSQRFL